MEPKLKVTYADLGGSHPVKYINIDDVQEYTKINVVPILEKDKVKNVFFRGISINTNSDNIRYGSTHIGSFNKEYDISIGVNGIEYASLKDNTTSWTTTSDRRDKIDFKDITDSLKFVNLLKPITFRGNNRDRYHLDDGSFNYEGYEIGSKSNKRRTAGFIAQDVYKNMIDVYNDDNYADIVDYSLYKDPNASEDKYSMRYSALIPFLTGAIQELSAKLDAATNKITELENTILELKSNNEQQ